MPRRLARFVLIAAAIALAVVSSAKAPAPDAARTLSVGGASIQLAFDPSAFSAGAGPIVEWAQRSAYIVAGYYGRFPAARATVRIVAEPGGGVHGGKTFANPDGFIRVTAGREVSDAQLRADWVLVHEMTHLALPEVGEAHAWLSEGIAVYVEGVARVQAGNRSETDVWAEELRAMPRGLPAAGDRGLDRTHSWGRTYWGGAMFCLMADVEIRRRTQLHFGLQDALRAVQRASGGLAAEWPIERVLRTGDDAVGSRTLEDLYAEMRDTPVTPDLMTLWRQLGIEPEGDTVRLSDAAPLAAVRRAIMHPPSAAAAQPSGE
ncbi:MAG TPA: hypothetical protein VK803_08055 [Steroidobacteraceae bacterium]|jgi:hypothetical protein|nr:hypothetical protein [Steroidobacteraceae bacterium]